MMRFVQEAIAGIREHAGTIQEVPNALMTLEGWKKVWKGLCIGGGGAGGAVVWCALVDYFGLPEVFASGYATPLAGMLVAAGINMVRTYLRRFHIVVQIEG